jgi:hypothetical protein
MDIKKQKQSSSGKTAGSSDDLCKISAPRAKRQKRVHGRDILGLSAQPLSNKQRRRLNRNKKREEQREQGRERRSARVRKDPNQAELTQQRSCNDEELNSLMSVLDFTRRQNLDILTEKLRAYTRGIQKLKILIPRL